MQRGKANTAALIAGLALLGWSAAGCSFSYSSESSAKSSAGSSDGSSASSTSSSPDSDKKKQAYREDVSDFTSSHAKRSPDADTFQLGLARIAERYGITNWEADSTTYVGIGEGLRRAGVDTSGLDTWKSTLSGSDRAKDGFIQQGYDATRG